LGDSFQENVGGNQKRNIKRTQDKTSLVSIEPNKHILITNDRPKEEALLPSKSHIKPFKKGFLNATPKNTKPKLKSQEMTKEEIPFIKPAKPNEQHDNIPGEVILNNKLKKFSFF